MTELELLDKEIRSLQYSLHHAAKKPNVSETELRNLYMKLELKTNIRNIVERAITNQKE